MRFTVPALFAAAGLVFSAAALAQQPAAHEKGMTKDEFVAHATERAKQQFDEMDTNHDGILTSEERRAARAARTQQHQGSSPAPQSGSAAPH